MEELNREINKARERRLYLNEIAKEMLQIAIDKKISCSEMHKVMLYLEDKVKQRAGEKEF